MKKIKKLTAIVLAVATSFTGIICNVSATEYKSFFPPAEPDAGIEIIKLNPSHDYVDEFINNYSTLNPDYNKTVINSKSCYNLLTDETTDKYNLRLFKSEESAGTYIYTSDDIIELGDCFGGFGVTSLAAGDLNHDGFNEFYFTYSWGSGIHRSHVGYFDTKTENIISFENYAYIDEDMILTDDDGVLTAHRAKPEEFKDMVHNTFSPDEKVAEIVCEDGKIDFKNLSDNITELQCDPYLYFPDWMPDSFDEAEKFFNKNGFTYIKDDVVCYTRLLLGVSSIACDIEFGKDSDVKKALKKRTFYKTNADGKIDNDHWYEVSCFKMRPGQKLHIEDHNLIDMDLSFVCDKNGEISETDIHGTLPDSYDEYKAFVAENGNISIQDNCVVYCGDINNSYTVGEKLTFKQSGTAGFKTSEQLEAYNYPFSYPHHYIWVYEPVSSGTLKTTWTITNKDDETVSEYTKYYAIDEKLSISEIDASEFTEPVKGDANGDGVITAADLLALKKWILGVSELKCWKCIDLNDDDVINVLDIIMLRNLILEK